MRAKTRRSREYPIMFYVSAEEKQAIVEAAENLDMSISDFCRMRLLNSSVFSPCENSKDNV